LPVSAAWSFAHPFPVDDPSLYKNRELSWLEFNQRVLDQARDDYHPLLERVKFLAIVSSNLDEFFMVRVATLPKKQRAGIEQLSIDGKTVVTQLAGIRQRAAVMMRDVSICWRERLDPGGVHVTGSKRVHEIDINPAVDISGIDLPDDGNLALAVSFASPSRTSSSTSRPRRCCLMANRPRSGKGWRSGHDSGTAPTCSCSATTDDDCDD